MFASLKNGLEDIVAALHKQLKGKILKGRVVQNIIQTGKNFQVMLNGNTSITCDAVICTVPANRAAPLSTGLNSNLARELSRIRFVSSAAISLGFRKTEFEAETEFDGIGFIISTSDRRNILSCGYTSRKSVFRATDGMTLLRLFVGGEGREEILKQSDESLVEIALAELKDRLGIECKPILERVFRWHQANPQFDVGHLDRVSAIEELTSRIPALFFTGCSYRGVGIPDCIANARNTVEQLIAFHD